MTTKYWFLDKKYTIRHKILERLQEVQIEKDGTIFLSDISISLDSFYKIKKNSHLLIKSQCEFLEYSKEIKANIIENKVNYTITELGVLSYGNDKYIKEGRIVGDRTKIIIPTFISLIGILLTLILNWGYKVNQDCKLNQIDSDQKTNKKRLDSLINRYHENYAHTDSTLLFSKKLRNRKLN